MSYLCFVCILSNYAERPVELGVGWAPTHADDTHAVLEWANVGAGDLFYELGCGDGRVAIEAAKRKAQVVCVEGDPNMLDLAKRASIIEGVADRIEMRLGDVTTTNVSDATVVYFFLLPIINVKLLPALERMPEGSRVIARDSQIYGWPCGRRLKRQGGSGHGAYMMWTLPVPREAQAGMPPDEEAVIEHNLDCILEDTTYDADFEQNIGRPVDTGQKADGERSLRTEL